MQKLLTALLALLTLTSSIQAEEPQPKLMIRPDGIYQAGKFAFWRYDLFIEGVERDKFYDLALGNLKCIDFSDPYNFSTSRVYINSSGKVVKNEMEGSSLLFTIAGMVYGEAFHYGLFDTEGKELASTRLTPFPFEIHDGKGHSLKGISTHPSGKRFVIEFNGYEEGEQLHITSTSGRKKAEYTLEYSENLEICVKPAVGRKTRGTLEYRVIGKDSDMTLKFNWGKGWTKMVELFAHRGEDLEPLEWLLT